VRSVWGGRGAGVLLSALSERPGHPPQAGGSRSEASGARSEASVRAWRTPAPDLPQFNRRARARTNKRYFASAAFASECATGTHFAPFFCHSDIP
jgi:hypothetical protein